MFYTFQVFLWTRWNWVVLLFALTEEKPFDALDTMCFTFQLQSVWRSTEPPGLRRKIAALFIFFIWIPISCFTQCLHLLKYYWWGTRLVIKLTVSLIISIFVSAHDRIRSVFTKSHLFRFIYFFGRGLWRCGISYILSGGSCRALSFALTHHIVIPRLLMLMS